MEDVGDGEVVAESGDDKRDGCDKDSAENYDSGAASSFAQALPTRIARKEEGNHAHPERIHAQRQGEEQGKTTNLRHEEESQPIFSETYHTGNQKKTEAGLRRTSVGRTGAWTGFRRQEAAGARPPRQDQMATSMRSAGGSVGELRSPQRASLRFRDRTRIPAARRASRRVGGFRPPG